MHTFKRKTSKEEIKVEILVGGKPKEFTAVLNKVAILESANKIAEPGTIAEGLLDFAHEGLGLPKSTKYDLDELLDIFGQVIEYVSATPIL